MTLTIMGLLIAFGWFATRQTGLVPNPFQVVAELFVETFWNLTKDALDEDMAKTYFPLICSLFMFLLLCNWIGIFPYMEEPTKDLNTTLGLGIMGVFHRPLRGDQDQGVRRVRQGILPAGLFHDAPQCDR